MIRTPTIFVVGAGGSHAYGLPLASDIKAAAVSMPEDSQIHRLLRSAGFSPEGLQEFVKDLGTHPASTIDEFLETRRRNQERVKYGRAVIAAEMGAALRSRVAIENVASEDWLGRILNWMRSEAQDFDQFIKGNEHVRFVTFNFDSIIEDRLLRDAKNAFGSYWSPERLAETVIHVHGALPKPPSGLIVHKDGPREVVPNDWTKWLSNAAEAINVLQDPIRDEIVSKAKKAIENAQIVCFLGFNYHPTNLTRLGIPDTIKKMQAYVFGSAMGVEPGRQSWVKGRFDQRIELGDINQSCLRVLDRFYIFRD